MLGQCVRAKVVKPIGYNKSPYYTYPLNFVIINGTPEREFGFIIGINHPVKYFDGRVIAVLEPYSNNRKRLWILAPKSSRFINIDILKYFNLEKEYKGYRLVCLYENSSGAVVYRRIGDEIRFLLIKNKRSMHWGFPKGHIEYGENKLDAARREVLEETGIHIKFHKGFETTSRYKVKGLVDKHVSIFVGTTDDLSTTIQKTEIADYIWLTYDKAMPFLRFDNDKRILTEAYNFLVSNNYISK